MPERRRPRILIADDDVALDELLEKSLAPLGYEVEIATNGQDTLSRAKTGAFDLILLDVMMPHIDGYHVAAELNSAMGERAPKILLMTCRDTRREGHFAVLTGAVGILQKPFPTAELVGLVQKHVPV